MDYVDRLTGRPGANTINWDGIFKFTDLTVPVQKHLEKVYLTLSLALLVSAAGVYAHILTHLGGLLSVIGFIGCTFWLLSTPPFPQNLNKRYALLGGIAFCQGLTMGPLIDMALQLHPSVVFTAFLGTAAVFACFTAAALLSRRRSYLYLGGTLSSAVTLFMVMRLASWLFSGARGAVYQLELYGGLLVFMGYVLFDTQMIVEKAYRGEKDHIKHALDLFVDFVAIFVRVLIILLKNAEKKEQRSRKRRS